MTRFNGIGRETGLGPRAARLRGTRSPAVRVLLSAVWERMLPPEPREPAVRSGRHGSGARTTHPREQRVREHTLPEYVDDTMSREMVGRLHADRLPRSLAVPPCQVLHLAHHHGYIHQEIATRLGMPPGTVKSHARRTLQRLVRRPALASAPA